MVSMKYFEVYPPSKGLSGPGRIFFCEFYIYTILPLSFINFGLKSFTCIGSFLTRYNFVCAYTVRD